MYGKSKCRKGVNVCLHGQIFKGFLGNYAFLRLCIFLYFYKNTLFHYYMISTKSLATSKYQFYWN